MVGDIRMSRMLRNAAWGRLSRSMQSMVSLLLGAVLLLVSGSGQVAAGSQAPSTGAWLVLEPSQTAMQEGDNFTFDVIVQAINVEVDAVDIFIAFDPEHLQFETEGDSPRVTHGSELTQYQIVNGDNAEGWVSYAAGRLFDASVTGEFLLVRFYFEATSGTRPSGTPIAFVFWPPSQISRTTDVYHNAGQSALVGVEHGVVQIEPPVVPCFDFNQQGMVDVDDIQQVASRWRDPAKYLPQYDVVPGGNIDILDILKVASQFGDSC